MTTYGSISLNVAETCPIVQFVKKRLVKGDPVVEEKCHQIVRRTLQGLSPAAGFLGTIPFIPICYQYAGENRCGYGTILAISNSGSFTWFTSWAFLKILEEEMCPRSDEEMELNRRSRASCYFSAAKVALIFVGITTQAPNSFMAYIYNQKNLSYGLFVLMANSGIPIYSLLKMAGDIRVEQMLTPFENRLHAIKGYLIEHLSQNQEMFFSLVKEKCDSLSCPEQFSEFLGRLFQREEAIEVEEEGQPLATATGAVLAGAYLFFIGTLGYHAVGLWTDSKETCCLGGMFVAACSSYLTFGGMINKAKHACNSIASLMNRSFQPSVSFQEKPNLAAGLWILGLALTALSYAPAEQVCQDYYSGWTQSAMEILVPAGTMLMIANAIGDFVDKIVLVQMEHWGTEEQKQLVEFLERLQHFERLLKNSPIPQFAKFLKQFPPRVAEKYLQRVQVSIEDLNRYLDFATF